MLLTQDLEKLKEEIQGTRELQDVAQLQANKVSSRWELMAFGAEFAVSKEDRTLGPKTVLVTQALCSKILFKVTGQGELLT